MHWTWTGLGWAGQPWAFFLGTCTKPAAAVHWRFRPTGACCSGGSSGIVVVAIACLLIVRRVGVRLHPSLCHLQSQRFSAPSMHHPE